MKSIKIISIFLIVLVLASWKNYSYKKAPTFKVAFYNCENLYDTINDLDVQDEEFTPAGKINGQVRDIPQRLNTQQK